MERIDKVSEGCGGPSCWPRERPKGSGLRLQDQARVTEGPVWTVGYRNTKKAL